MKTNQKQSFFKNIFKFALIFLIFITILKVIITALFYSSYTEMLREYFSKDTWKQFAGTQITISVIYGLFMAVYYKFIKK